MGSKVAAIGVGEERRTVAGVEEVASLKVLGVEDVEASSRRSIVRVYSSVPSNTPLERTIGVGILVKERQRLTPLAAQRPC